MRSGAPVKAVTSANWDFHGNQHSVLLVFTASVLLHVYSINYTEIGVQYEISQH